jgi:acyl-CoA thioesterase
MSTPTNPLANDHFAAANGIELLEARTGYARTRLTATAEHLNSVGTVHGGALFTLAATAFFAACNFGRQTTVGIHMDLACTAPGRCGILTAEAQEVSRSRRIATCVVRITDERDVMIASFQASAYIKGSAAVA